MSSSASASPVPSPAMTPPLPPLSLEAMAALKEGINLVVIGHVDAGKSLGQSGLRRERAMAVGHMVRGGRWPRQSHTWPPLGS